MVYKISRLLQLVGLVVLPVAVSGNVSGQLTLWQSLIVSGVGVLMFYVGWQLQQWSVPP